MNGKLGAFVATTRPDEARAFYERTLGLVLVSERFKDPDGNTLSLAQG